MPIRIILLLLFFSVALACRDKVEKVNTTTTENASDNESESTTEKKETFTITFGSCNDEDKAQPLWKDIVAEKPNLWIWLGDNIYGDSENMGVLQRKYDKQNSNKGYQSLKAQTSIIGTWDDHDFGVNDGGKDYAKKAESRELALDFLGVPADAEVRAREGMYQSYTYTYKEVVIRIILLDTRYFKDHVQKGANGYIPDENADILGDTQWAWLESELKKKEDVLIVANGTQVIPTEHPYEKWANFPTSRSRILSLLSQDDAEKIVLLSGDRHIGEISKIAVNGKAIWEVTSSGLTHSYESVGNEPNKYRVGAIMSQLNYGVIHVDADKQVELIISGREGKRHEVQRID